MYVTSKNYATLCASNQKYSERQWALEKSIIETS